MEQSVSASERDVDTYCSRAGETAGSGFDVADWVTALSGALSDGKLTASAFVFTGFMWRTTSVALHMHIDDFGDKMLGL